MRGYPTRLPRRLSDYTCSVRVVYYQPGDAAQAPFRDGRAAVVDLEHVVERRVVAIGPNSYHALFHFGVVPRLARLPQEGGPLARDADVVFYPTALDSAIELLYEAERVTWGGEHEMVVEGHRNPVEYRVRLDRREYQRTLLRLVDLFRESARHGCAARLAL